MKRVCCVVLCLIILAQGAAALPAMGALSCKSAVLFASNGQLLYEYNADEPLQPASVTKVMTMLLAMEAVDRGEAALTDMVTGSAHAASMGGTQIWLKEGEQLSLDDMLKAIAVGSANDCAVAVAEHLKGTEAAFVERMNARAKELGCTHTTFVNANGLDADGQKTLTSARDLGLISVELLRHPKILNYTKIWMDSVRNGQFSLANTNKMLKSYSGLIGLKTGYISEAGFCISAAAEREEMTLVAIVMAAPTKEARTADAAALLNYGYANFAQYTPQTPALEEIPVLLGAEKGVMPEMQMPDRSLVLEKERAAALKTEVALADDVQAPVSKGQQLGVMTVTDGHETLLTVPLVASNAVERIQYPAVFQKLLGWILMEEQKES